MLASDARRAMPGTTPAARRAAGSSGAASRRTVRLPVLARPAVRRGLLHLVCLGLVALAAGPLAGLSSVGSRSQIAEDVQRFARLVAAQAEADAPGGWMTPRFPLTLAEANLLAPPSPALPVAPLVGLSEASSSAPPAESGGAAAVVPAAPAPAASAAAEPGAAPVAAPIPNPAHQAARAALAQRFSHLSEVYGVMVLDAEGLTIFEHQAAAQFPAASLYKLGVAAEAYRQQRAGMIAFRDPLVITRESLADGDMLFTERDVGKKITIGQAVDFMITRSSNVAAILLLRRLGPANVNTMFADLGMADTRLLERPFRNVYGNARNQTSPRDMARFFRLLLYGKVVDIESSQAIIKLLLRQQIDDRLPAALPRGVPIAHKTGNLVGVVHDAGIIYSPAGPLIVVSLSQDIVSEDEAYTTIATLARVAYDAYTSAGGQP